MCEGGIAVNNDSIRVNKLPEVLVEISSLCEGGVAVNGDSIVGRVNKLPEVQVEISGLYEGEIAVNDDSIAGRVVESFCLKVICIIASNVVDLSRYVRIDEQFESHIHGSRRAVGGPTSTHRWIHRVFHCLQEKLELINLVIIEGQEGVMACWLVSRLIEGRLFVRRLCSY